MDRNHILFFGLLIFIAALSGCVGSAVRAPEIYPAPKDEADWIRNAEPIEFENASWYPVDDVENLLDAEMFPAGTYREVQFFVEKADIRPFHRIYTKFSKHKYRVFEKLEKSEGND